MGTVIGFIFWMFIAIKVGNAIGKGIGGEINVWHYKRYFAEEDKIKMKYNGGQKYGGYIFPGHPNYDKYKTEIDVLKSRYGM